LQSPARWLGDRWFTQVLDREPQAVEETFDLIAGNTPHANPKIIITPAVSGRLFEDWATGFATVPNGHGWCRENAGGFGVGHETGTHADRAVSEGH
jgi:hypothetical protein